MLTPVDVCFLTISSILFVMYVVFLISLVAYRTREPLRSGFFKLTFMLGVFDVLQMAHIYVFLRFPSFGWMTEDIYLKLPPAVIHYASCTMWALGFNQHVTVVFIALNRLSAVVFPHDHKRRWRHSRTRLITVIITLAGPIYVTPKLLISKEQYTIINLKIRAATIVWDNQDLLLKYKYFSFITLIIASGICFFCYCSIIYTTLKRHLMTAKRKTLISSNRRRSSNSPVPVTVPRRKSGCTVIKPKKQDFSNFTITRLSIKNQNRNISSLIQKRELKLATCGFIIFFFMFIYTIGIANMGVSESARMQQANRGILLATSDIFSGINPILLIIVSKSLRSKFLAVLCCSCTERQYSPSQSNV